jgi:hypothetical protein
VVQLSVSVENEIDKISLEDEYARQLMESIQKEIDEEVLRTIFLESGWTQVKFNFLNNTQAVDVLLWCEHNVTKEDWIRLNDYFVFRLKKDVEWFMLRWL